jgi:hypothetical protein
MSGEAPLVRIAADGSVEPVVKTRAFEFPHDVVVLDGQDGPVAIVSDNYARTLWKVAADGSVASWVKGDPLAGPVGLAGDGADVLVATGTHTGAPTALADARALREAGLPVAVGSGVTPADAAALAAVADALIVGSSLKEGGDWRRPVETSRVRAVVAAARGG